MFKALLPYMKKYKYSTIFAPLSIIAEVLLEISIPVLMSRIVDIGIPRQDLAYIVKIGLLMVLMAILGMFAGALSSRLAAKAWALQANCATDCLKACKASAFPI